MRRRRRRSRYLRTVQSRVQNRGYMRHKRVLAKKRGKCMTCFRAWARRGRSTCEGCAKTTLRGQRRRARERYAAGLCVRCGLVPATVRDRLCAGCEQKRIEAPSYGANVTIERRQADNLCRDCGLISAFDKTRCADCLKIEAERQKARVDERIAVGLCYRCGRHPAPKKKPRTSCFWCRKKRRTKVDRRRTPPPKALKRCGKCGEAGHRQSDAVCRLWVSTRA